MAGSSDYYDDEKNQDMSTVLARLGLDGAGTGPTTVQTDGPGGPTMKPEGSLAEKVAMAIAAGVGGAAGGLGSDARPPEAPAPAPAQSIRYYDDRAPKPERSLKEMAMWGLLPLAGGLLGGFQTGNRGAWLGAEKGLEGVGGILKNQEDRYAKLQDQKELNRSHLVTAKLLRDVGGGKDGAGSINKNRYQKVDGIDPATGTPYTYTFDRQEGKAGQLQGLDGTIIPYTSDIYKRWRPVSGAVSPVPVAAVAPGGAQPAPAPAAAPDDSGKMGLGEVKSIVLAPKKKAGPAAGQATKLPPAVKQPAGAGAQAQDKPDIMAPAVVPAGQEVRSMDAAAQERDAIVQGLEEQIAEGKAELGMKPRDGESIMDGEQRHKDATQRIKDAQKAIDTANQNYANHIARVGEQLSRPSRASTNPRNDPDSELNIRRALDTHSARYRQETSKIRQANQAASKIDDLVSLGASNPMAAAAVARQLARASGETGVMTDKDISDFQGSQAIQARFDRMIGKMEKGNPMTDEDRTFASDLAKRMKAKTDSDLEDVAQDHVNGFTAIYGEKHRDRAYSSFTGKQPGSVKAAPAPADSTPQYSKGDRRTFGGVTYEFQGGKNVRANWKEVTK